MRKYGEAIRLSISSAQQVFNISEDAITLVKTLENGTTTEEIERYLFGMANLTAEGLEKTKKSLSVFKDVRKTIISVSKSTSLHRSFLIRGSKSLQIRPIPIRRHRLKVCPSAVTTLEMRLMFGMIVFCSRILERA